MTNSSIATCPNIAGVADRAAIAGTTGRISSTHKACPTGLPYSAFDKDQRVTHAAITENKRLSAVLEFITDAQDKAPPKTRRAGKQRTRCQPTGRRNDGWNSKLAKATREKRAASQGCDA